MGEQVRLHQGSLRTAWDKLTFFHNYITNAQTPVTSFFRLKLNYVYFQKESSINHIRKKAISIKWFIFLGPFYLHGLTLNLA